MANPGRIVAEIGKALGKAIIAGVGLELARVATKAVKVRLGARDDDDDATTRKKAKAETNDVDDAAALRRENAALREELGVLRREFEAERRKP